MPMPTSVSDAKKSAKPLDASHPVHKRIAVLFPGQGSQSVGMLCELNEQYPQVATTFAEASDALGEDLWAICQDEHKLNQTEYTQPALLTASMAIWRILQDALHWHPAVDDKSTHHPVFLAGHSLGEYSALCAGGAISLADAVQLVHQRGKLMVDAVQNVSSKMLAVLGLDDQQVISLCEQAESQYDDAVVSVANFNSPSQVVVAGNTVGVDAVQSLVASMGKRAVPLKVSVPSHCALMTPASDDLAKALNARRTLTLPHIEVIQNRHAKIEHTLPELKTALIEQLHHPVLWTQTMQSLADKHVTMLVECGAGTVLSNLAKRQTTPITCLPTDKPDRLTKVITSIKEANT